MSALKNIRQKYNNDFLDKVLVRVDFDSPLIIAESGPDKRIYEAIKERFPKTEVKKIEGQKLFISPEQTQTQKIESKQWHYYGKNREKELVIATEFMYIQYNIYELYETLYDDFNSVLTAIYESYSDVHIKRLGLRYIDHINISDNTTATDWGKYLKPELCAIFDVADDKKTIARAFHILEFNYGDDFLKFQYGMHNPDYPAPIKKKLYTLDFDMSTSKIMDKKEVLDSLGRFHDKLNDSFEEVITEELRLLMGVK